MMENSIYSFIEGGIRRPVGDQDGPRVGGGVEGVGVVIPVFSEINAPHTSFIPDNKNIIEDAFKKRFDEFSNKIIPPCIPKKENVGRWDDLCDKIDRFLERKMASYYGEEFVDKIKEVKEESKEDVKEFERKLERLVAERSTLLIESKEIMIENSDILIEKLPGPEVKVNNDSEDKILHKYKFNCSSLREQLNLYEKTIISAGKEMMEHKQKIEDCHKNIKKIKEWVKDVPFIFKENADLEVVHDAIMSQLKKYTEEHNYIKLLEDFKQSYIDFLYLMSHSDNFFKKPHKCTICLTGDITHALVPCGHCFCLSCSNKIQRNKCHMCRQVVKSKIKLHI